MVYDLYFILKMALLDFQPNSKVKSESIPFYLYFDIFWKNKDR